MCPFVVLGKCLAMFEESFDKDRQFVFINEGSDVGRHPMNIAKP